MRHKDQAPSEQDTNQIHSTTSPLKETDSLSYRTNGTKLESY